MASQAQVLANSRNAEKSTGPRTEKGKAASCQNAVKHGLFARQDAISTEDRADFDSHRELMLGELTPLGSVETMLAERIVGLSWRLKRAQHMQDEAFDYLLSEDASGAAGESGGLGSFLQTADSGDGDPVLGRVVVKDFSKERVLERLLMYERRIEQSLYRAMNELHTMKARRRMEREEEAVRRWNMEHGYGASPNPEPRSLTPGTPYGGQPCKTNPIPAGVGGCVVRGGEGAMAAAARVADEKTKPNASGRIDFLPEVRAATIMASRNGMLE